MAARRTREHGRDAAVLAATCFVVLLGLAACAFIVSLLSGDPTKPLLTVGGSVLLLAVLLRLLRDRPQNRSLEGKHFWLTQKDEESAEPLAEYQCRPRKNRDRKPLGSNQPPTAETVRELTETHNHWVPARRLKRKNADE
jgi:hypothetical protein